ncbi:MAG: HipA N-terminal domain-containing protein [Planctomycetota bacterium]|nr:HipA N-terminal domain-containing protein [Planctomycetota bacterium]
MSSAALRTASVQLSGRRCGVLEELPGGRTRFTYDAAWLADRSSRPVSLTMPLRTEPYEAPGLLPFFANLLSEGWLLDVSLARLKIARDDAFGLLLATCRDCMGDVEVVPTERTA